MTTTKETASRLLPYAHEVYAPSYIMDEDGLDGEDDPWWVLMLCVFCWPYIVGMFLREIVFKRFFEEDE